MERSELPAPPSVSLSHLGERPRRSDAQGARRLTRAGWAGGEHLHALCWALVRLPCPDCHAGDGLATHQQQSSDQ